jgi:murein DD-endopeptidase MepM/ murein hydrolase activator NlpD
MSRRPPAPALLAALAILALLVLAASAAAEPGAAAPPANPGETTAPAPAPEAPTTVELPAPPPSPPPPPPAPAPTSKRPVPVPQVKTQRSQGATPGAGAPARQPKPSVASPNAAGENSTARAGQRAPSPSALTPLLPPGLQSSIAGVPAFFIESFRIPPFLMPIFQAAGTAYGIPWQVLAAINEVETDYGRDLSVSSAGAEGWMQFLPGEWAQYGVDANGDGFKDPYNPADAIFAAARYLRAAGGETDIRAAVFSYNHSPAYVDSVMLRAQLLGGTPSELIGAITGLTEARFPVHAAAHFSDGFSAVTTGASGGLQTLAGTTIYSQAGAPVIAVQDGEIVQMGDSPALGRFVSMRDAFGNTYTYAELGDVAALYPVLQPHVHSALSTRIAHPGERAEAPPTGPATAGAQPRSPVSEGATVSALALGAAAALEPPPPAPPAQPTPPSRPPAPRNVHVFTSGSSDVYLHPLHAGVQVIAGTVLGHVGASSGSEPHVLFQIRPAGTGAPPIDPKPILDGWVALENTSIFRAKGENPFLATSPTTGQVLLESKQQLEPQVLHDGGIRLGACGRQAVQSASVDKRVLAMLEYLSVSGLKPTVSGLRCAGSTPAALAANAAVSSSGESIDITAINGIPLAGHQGQGSIADTAVRKLLMLQGASRPQRIVSEMSYPGAAVAVASPGARDAIHVSFSSLAAAGARAAGLGSAALSPGEWVKLIARLGEIPDPTVTRAPSSAAIRDTPSSPGSAGGGESSGNG